MRLMFTKESTCKSNIVLFTLAKAYIAVVYEDDLQKLAGTNDPRRRGQPPRDFYMRT